MNDMLAASLAAGRLSPIHLPLPSLLLPALGFPDSQVRFVALWPMSMTDLGIVTNGRLTVLAYPPTWRMWERHPLVRWVQHHARPPGPEPSHGQYAWLLDQTEQRVFVGAETAVLAVSRGQWVPAPETADQGVRMPSVHDRLPSLQEALIGTAQHFRADHAGRRLHGWLDDRWLAVLAATPAWVRSLMRVVGAPLETDAARAEAIRWRN